MRRLIYVTLASLLALLGIVGIREAENFRRTSEERDLRALRDNLVLVVDRWEDGITGAIKLELGNLSSTDRVRARERELHKQSRAQWFDAFYIWDPDEVAWPAPQAEEDLALLRSDPCMADASKRAGAVDAVAAAFLYRGCMGRSAPVTLLAASEAVELFLNADQPAAAARVIRELGPVLGPLAIQAANEYGVSPRRLVYLRLQAARTQDILGRTDIAGGIVWELAEEIALLDGATLELVLDLWDYPISRDLRAYGGPMLGGEDDELSTRAARRLALFQEVRARTWNLRDLPTVDQGPRLLVDQVGDPPYLLYFAKLDMGALIGGVALDQPELVKNFIQSLPRRLRPYLSVRDPTGRVLAGSDDALTVEVAFTTILPHLRVGLAKGAYVPDSGFRTAFLQLMPIAIGILIGAFSLFGLIHTDREQARLLEQQRAFMARVTHELKTPLAGIRLMAENLEMGSFRDSSQREKFARQIVKEAERLGERLDEVIRAAARPIDELPSAIDPGDMAETLADRWRPLFEQHGVTLHVEAQRGHKMIARPAYLRDALTNLLDNALKYRDPEKKSEVWLRVRVETRWVEFDVEDNGIGVPANMRKAVFEKFRRVEGPGRGKSGGHGLGLAFVAESARLHGGKVECREGVAGGARFLFRIRRRS
jgi:signal transduction histidine kinase